MRRKQSADHQTGSKAFQFDLFAQAQERTVPLPEWQSLPAQTREALTGLMVDLIIGHDAGERPLSAKGGQKDV